MSEDDQHVQIPEIRAGRVAGVIVSTLERQASWQNSWQWCRAYRMHSKAGMQICQALKLRIPAPLRRFVHFCTHLPLLSNQNNLCGGRMGGVLSSN